MMHIESAAVSAQVTFGRDGAMFEGLLGFVAKLSLVLWTLVLLTLVVRFVGIRIYRHGAARRGVVEPVAPSVATAPEAAAPAALLAPAPTVPAVRAPAGFGDGLKTDAGLRPAVRVRALAGNSVEA